MNKLAVSFIVRFHYKEDDSRFIWRYQHFVEKVLPRIYAQTYKDFDICIWCNDWHKHFFESIGLKTFNVNNEVIKYKQHKHKPNKRFFHDFKKWEDVIGLEKYDLQLGLDSDDFIEPKYVEIIIKEIEKRKEGNKSIHLCYEPEMIRLDTGKICKLGNYHINRGSAFMALYQPNKENYRFIYEESHISIIKKADIKVILPKGYAFATAHSLNESTGL